MADIAFPGVLPSWANGAIAGVRYRLTSAIAALQNFDLSMRLKSGISFPVPFLRPMNGNTVVALDIIPRGTPTENAGNGYAWIDICAKDVVGDTYDQDNATWTCRLAALSDGVELGEIVTNSATPVPVYLIIPSAGGTKQRAVKLSTDQSVEFAGRVTFDVGAVTKATTFAGLPSSPADGQRGFVTDSSVAASGNFGAAAAGSGTSHVPVYYEAGTPAWRIG